MKFIFNNEIFIISTGRVNAVNMSEGENSPAEFAEGEIAENQGSNENNNTEDSHNIGRQDSETVDQESDDDDDLFLAPPPQLDDDEDEELDDESVDETTNQSTARFQHLDDSNSALDADATYGSPGLR